ncbi:MAG: sugar transferase [Deltaproteobacteria bacterium]|nr:sugar transferase [Deltaproteobacteria bacterium]
MSSISVEEHLGVTKLRRAAWIVWDMAASACGLYAATVVVLGSEAPESVGGTFLALVPALVILRLGSSYGAQIHRWNTRAPRFLDAARLLLVAGVSTAILAVVYRGVAPSLYLLETFFSATLMAAPRFAPTLAEEFDRARLPEVHARFVTAERPRRLLNVVVAAAGLVLTLPAWVLIAIAVKLTSRGPIFYKQERIGLDLRGSGGARPADPRRKVDLGGRPFMMIKFRTMCVDAEAGTGAVWSSGKADPRVTPIGKFLRHYRLDELPQLLNVIRGDMNVVGPRPERATIFADMRAKIPDYPVRQRARPGITGYAQINLEADLTVEDVADKVKYDIVYVKRQSVWMDFCIMAKTLPVMLFRDKMLARAERQPVHQ